MTDWEKRTHRCTETTIDLQNSEFVEVRVILRLGERVIRNDLVIGGRFDAIPITERDPSIKSASMMLETGMYAQILALGTFGEITREEVEEGLHLRVECLRVSCQCDGRRRGTSPIPSSLRDRRRCQLGG